MSTFCCKGTIDSSTFYSVPSVKTGLMGWQCFWVVVDHIYSSVSCCVCLQHSSLQPFSSGRQVVLERPAREQGARKEWHGGSSSQGGVFSNSRRMGDSRGSMMAPSRYIPNKPSNDVKWVFVAAILTKPLSLQPLDVRTEPNCTDHEQLAAHQWHDEWIQILQGNSTAVLTATSSTLKHQKFQKALVFG